MTIVTFERHVRLPLPLCSCYARLCLFLAKVDGKLTADNSGSFSVLTPNWGNFSLFFEEDPLLGTCLTPDMTDIDAMSLGGDWIETCFPDDEDGVAAAKIIQIIFLQNLSFPLLWPLVLAI